MHGNDLYDTSKYEEVFRYGCETKCGANMAFLLEKMILLDF